MSIWFYQSKPMVDELNSILNGSSRWDAFSLQYNQMGGYTNPHPSPDIREYVKQRLVEASGCSPTLSYEALVDCSQTKRAKIADLQALNPHTSNWKLLPTLPERLAYLETANTARLKYVEEQEKLKELQRLQENEEYLRLQEKEFEERKRTKKQLWMGLGVGLLVGMALLFGIQKLRAKPDAGSFR